MTITPLTASEYTALATKTMPAQTAASPLVVTPWEKDDYTAAPPESPYPAYEPSQIVLPETDRIKHGLVAKVDDELYAAIVNKHSEGGFTLASFKAMVNELMANRLITIDQRREIDSALFHMETTARYFCEANGKLFVLEDYLMNHRFSVNDLFVEIMDIVENMRINNGQRKEFDMLEDFALKMKEMAKSETNGEDGLVL